MASLSSIVPASVLRNLSDKLYEKRRNAALVMEVKVKQLADAGERDKIKAVINFLAGDRFAGSPQSNHRKGGLIGLSAVAVGLNLAAVQHLDRIVPPVLNSFSDRDSSVRYYACEALYNIAKVVRDDFMVFFNGVFDALCKLFADSDTNVQSAAHLLDRLVKDIVTESDQFSIEDFIPLLRERINMLNPETRQFLVGWITVLDGVPDIDMLFFLPEFLDGLFNMLSDSLVDIREQADTALSEFLEEIRTSQTVHYGGVAEILVRKAASDEEFIRLTAITWINELVKLAGDQLVPFYVQILGAILPCVSDMEEKIRVIARETNEELFHAIKVVRDERFDAREALFLSKKYLSSGQEATRIEALNWIAALLNWHQKQVLPFLSDILDTLLKGLSDPSDDVVLLALEVHAFIAQNSQHFLLLVEFLVHIFRVDESLLERRGAMIISRLCALLGAERVYRKFAAILQAESDLNFAFNMVQALNMILLTSPDLSPLRGLLKQSLVNGAGKDLFLYLYLPWCHSPVAVISLCLLGQAYQHASSLIKSMVEQDINVRFLVQLDKLINLLETPTFAYLRLQLLQTGRNEWLLKALNALLMVLPQQSAASNILWTRLEAGQLWGTESGRPYPLMNGFENGSNVGVDDDSQNVQNGMNFSSRLQQFDQMLRLHRLHAKSRSGGTPKNIITIATKEV